MQNLLSRYSNLRKAAQSDQILQLGLHSNPIGNFAGQQYGTKNNYCKILDVKDKSSQVGDIKQAPYSIVKQYHSDVNKGDSSRFKEVNEAYEVLGDDSKRKDYDSMRKCEASQSSSSSSRTSSSDSNCSNTSYSRDRNTGDARSSSSNNNQQYQYYCRDPGGDPYSSGQQQSQEEIPRNYFRQFGQTQKQLEGFEAEMRKREKNSHTVNTEANRTFDESFYGYEYPRQNSKSSSQSQGYNQGYDQQNPYREMQEDIFRNYKDEEYKSLEEIERLRKRKEMKFMQETENKFSEQAIDTNQ